MDRRAEDFEGPILEIEEQIEELERYPRLDAAGRQVGSSVRKA